MILTPNTQNNNGNKFDNLDQNFDRNYGIDSRILPLEKSAEANYFKQKSANAPQLKDEQDRERQYRINLAKLKFRGGEIKRFIQISGL